MKAPTVKLPQLNLEREERDEEEATSLRTLGRHKPVIPVVTFLTPNSTNQPTNGDNAGQTRSSFISSAPTQQTITDVL